MYSFALLDGEKFAILFTIRWRAVAVADTIYWDNVSYPIPHMEFLKKL